MICFISLILADVFKFASSLLYSLHYNEIHVIRYMSYLLTSDIGYMMLIFLIYPTYNSNTSSNDVNSNAVNLNLTNHNLFHLDTDTGIFNPNTMNSNVYTMDSSDILSIMSKYKYTMSASVLLHAMAEGILLKLNLITGLSNTQSINVLLVIYLILLTTAVVIITWNLTLFYAIYLFYYSILLLNQSMILISSFIMLNINIGKCILTDIWNVLWFSGPHYCKLLISTYIPLFINFMLSMISKLIFKASDGVLLQM